MIFREISRIWEMIFGKKPGGKNMTSYKKPELVDIEVNVTWNDPNDKCNVSFNLEEKQGHRVKVGKNSNGKDRVTFENKDIPGFIIFFNIVEIGGSGCQFLPDPDDAMWVQPSALTNPPCPRNPAYWSQFRAIDVIDMDANNRNKTLMVCNQNDYKQNFAFTLRFEIEGCDTIFELDPIGDNQNGSQ